jgi:hypothetical protein
LSWPASSYVGGNEERKGKKAGAEGKREKGHLLARGKKTQESFGAVSRGGSLSKIEERRSRGRIYIQREGFNHSLNLRF